MLVKFKIDFIDGSSAESHDEMYNEIYDHVHFMPPNCTKQWAKYHIITDHPTNNDICVDFLTGVFTINGVAIHPASEEQLPLTNREDPQVFDNVQEPWNHFNGLPYFPIVGRRILKGDWGETKLYLCGWKRRDGLRTVEKVAFLYPTGAIVLT